MSELIDKVRKQFTEADEERDALMTTPEDVERWDNIVYGKLDRKIQVPEGFALTAIALNCGMYSIDKNDPTQTMTLELMKDFLPEQGTEEELKKINVLNRITDVYPPVFCMTAVKDFLRPQAAALVEKLADNQVPFVYRVFGDKVNQLGHVFHCDVKTVDAAQCNDAECDFFREFCF